jgi:hypothetical protein
MLASVLLSGLVLSVLTPAVLNNNPSNIPIVGFVVAGLPIFLTIILFLRSRWDPTYPGIPKA